MLVDYDSWEQGLSAQDLKHVQNGSQIHSGMIYYIYSRYQTFLYFVVDLQDVFDPGVENDSTEHMSGKSGVLLRKLPTENITIDSQHPEDEYILSPSLDEYPLRSRRRERSQTAPQLMNESPQSMYPQPLRRNQTSPLHNKASSAQLDALRHAYAVVTDMGTSQVDVQDIMQAKRLAHQISQVLDEQMCVKFGAHSNIQGGIGWYIQIILVPLASLTFTWNYN